MRAVVDTNIIIRAVIKPAGTVGPVLGRLRDGDYTAVYSGSILDELVAKLALPRIAKKYQLSQGDIEDLLGLLALRGRLVNPSRTVRVCRDPGDDMFIEAALEGEADWVVTGDSDLLTLEKFERIRFVPPRVFLQAFTPPSEEHGGA
jgi:putative PIN family toxin of toxin-antitoxin system